MVHLPQMYSVGGWTSGWVSKAISTGTGIPPTVTLWISPDVFCAPKLDPVSVLKPEQVGKQETEVLSAALQLQDCSMPEVGATSLVLVLKTPRGTAQTPNLLGCCWHLVEQQGSSWQQKNLICTKGVSQPGLTLYCRVHIQHPLLSQKWVPAKKEITGIETCHSSSPRHPHNIGSQHYWTQHSLYNIYLVFAPFTS